MPSTRVLAAILGISGALLLTSGAAQATGTLDQQQTDTSGDPQYVTGAGECCFEWAQTFTAGITGQLDQVDLFLGRGGAEWPFLVLIEPVSNGTPVEGPEPLAVSEVPAEVPVVGGGWVPIPIAPTPVTAGTQYAIVTFGAGGLGGGYFWFSASGDVYAGGSFFFASCLGGGFGCNPPPRPIDLAFKTYVEPADTTPPEIACSATPSTLWPPNHKLGPVSVDVSASDDSGSVTVTLVSVASSQADSGLDAEDIPNDIQGWTTGADDRSGLLRAERFEQARTYTLTYQAEDPAGNTAPCTTTVTVPKSQKSP